MQPALDRAYSYAVAIDARSTARSISVQSARETEELSTPTIMVGEHPDVADTPHAEYSLPGLDQMERRHHALMAGYLTALDDASSMSGGEGKATRLLVGSHIRARTLSLGKRYAQLRQVCGPERPAERTWLKETGDGCVQFADSLYSLRLPSVFVLIPLVLSLGAKAAEVPLDLYVVVLTTTSAIFYLIAAPLGIISAFRNKREIFLPGGDQTIQDPSSAGVARNIYKDEDELFGVLRQPKPREAQLDGLVEGTLLGVVVGVAGYLLFWRWGINLPSDFEDAWIVVAFVLPIIVFERRNSRRTWR